jgi:hypothetical protein
LSQIIIEKLIGLDVVDVVLVDVETKHVESWATTCPQVILVQYFPCSESKSTKKCIRRVNETIQSKSL